MDERILHFTPAGLGHMEPEDALAFQQHVIGRISLAADVAEGTRRRFEQLRHVYRYGLLCYDVFTMVGDAALLVFEQALRDRFIEFHKGVVPVRDSQGQVQQLAVRDYADFMTQYPRNSRIQMGPDRQWERFTGMLDSLYRWARCEGLLRGERNRGAERAVKELRNMVAHPNGYHLDSPVDAARTMSDLAEVINQLWGHPTPGGRLYPAPIERSVVAIGWSDAEGRIAICQAENLHEGEHAEGWTFVLIQAVFTPGEAEDPELWHFDSLFENTAYPCDLLWGPGTQNQALAWLETTTATVDACDHLDRVFLLRYDGQQLHMPQRPDVAAGMDDDGQPGTWFAVRADFPADAFSHVRALLEGNASQHAASGECRGCHATTLTRGTRAQALAAAERAGMGTKPVQPTDVRTPSWAPRAVTITS
ncbi:hypothetical protein [Streptomyces sp. NPDC005012]|uniref:hypothetical protein n=1 Tax=Streptomyces sp. NPDC005012 TaxID=3154558 RepID=UPI0033B95EAE